MFFSPSLHLKHPTKVLSPWNASITNKETTKQPGSKPIDTTFELSDTLFAKAKIPPTDEVYLWLGVRITYPSPPLFSPYFLTLC